ncbi:hypothetical protein AC579_3453 [Pseudocercospora musae]|uniref:Uncharacterized protein n=1 Tax=Pseudocercospora musae TaxID=113226 RepID=A0A139HV78_9PEZI|nr:hypothetical protein AC579_3453 [Pseudocercospora musae]
MCNRKWSDTFDKTAADTFDKSAVGECADSVSILLHPYQLGLEPTVLTWSKDGAQRICDAFRTLLPARRRMRLTGQEVLGESNAAFADPGASSIDRNPIEEETPAERDASNGNGALHRIQRSQELVPNNRNSSPPNKSTTAAPATSNNEQVTADPRVHEQQRKLVEAAVRINGYRSLPRLEMKAETEPIHPESWSHCSWRRAHNHTVSTIIRLNRQSPMLMVDAAYASDEKSGATSSSRDAVSQVAEYRTASIVACSHGESSSNPAKASIAVAACRFKPISRTWRCLTTPKADLVAILRSSVAVTDETNEEHGAEGEKTPLQVDGKALSNKGKERRPGSERLSASRRGADGASATEFQEAAQAGLIEMDLMSLVGKSKHVASHSGNGKQFFQSTGSGRELDPFLAIIEIRRDLSFFEYVETTLHCSPEIELPTSGSYPKVLCNSGRCLIVRRSRRCWCRPLLNSVGPSRSENTDFRRSELTCIILHRQPEYGSWIRFGCELCLIVEQGIKMPRERDPGIARTGRFWLGGGCRGNLQQACVLCKKAPYLLQQPPKEALNDYKALRENHHELKRLPRLAMTEPDEAESCRHSLPDTRSQQIRRPTSRAGESDAELGRACHQGHTIDEDAAAKMKELLYGGEWTSGEESASLFLSRDCNPDLDVVVAIMRKFAVFMFITSRADTASRYNDKKTANQWTQNL